MMMSRDKKYAGQISFYDLSQVSDNDAMRYSDSALVPDADYFQDRKAVTPSPF